ncbi:biopolymer transporter Tol [Xanthomonas sp. Kuri4-1]
MTGSPRLPYRLITSGGGFDLTPTLSPDASMVAYTSMTPDRPGTAILVKTTNNASPRVLSKPAPGQSDRLPAWSPDGRDIAFARQDADGRCQVMVTAANGGDDEREVARCDDSEMLSFSWSPDGTSLLFGSMTGRNASAGLRLLDLRTGQWRALAYPSDRTGFDYAPRYSPDGRWIAFVRNPQMGDLWLLPAQGGTPRPLTRENAEIRGWDWLPDSRGVVFGQRVDSQSRLYRLDLDSHRVRDLGISDAQTPALSDGKLAFVQRKPQFGIYRIQRDATDGSLRRQRLFASTGRDSQSIVSPSGRQLVFTSDRSGEYALWWASLADPQSLRPIEGLIPEARQAPDWSPDSLSLLVVARDGDGEPLLHEVLPALNRSVVLPVQEPRPLQAVYLSDPQRILVLGAEGDGNATLALYDRSVTPWRRLRTLADVSQVRFDREHGRVLFTRFSGDGLWRVDEALDPASVQALDTGNPSRWQYRSWALGPQGRVHYLFSSDRCPTYEGVIGPGAGDGHCLDGENFSALNGFSVDRADGTLYVPLAIEDGSGIGFMTLPKEPSSLVGVVSKWLSPLGK